MIVIILIGALGRGPGRTRKEGGRVEVLDIVPGYLTPGTELAGWEGTGGAGGGRTAGRLQRGPVLMCEVQGQAVCRPVVRGGHSAVFGLQMCHGPIPLPPAIPSPFSSHNPQSNPDSRHHGI